MLGFCLFFWMHAPDMVRAEPQPASSVSETEASNTPAARPSDLDGLMEGFEDAPDGGDKGVQELLEGFEDNAASDPGKEAETLFKGFEDDTAGSGPEEISINKDPRSWSLNGEFQLTSICNIRHSAPDAGETDWRGLSMLRPELGLEVGGKLSETWQARIAGKGFYDLVYPVKGRSDFTGEVLDQYESELELLETYIQGSLTSRLDTKIGRQIVVWGTLDSLRITDVLNPLDLRVPGLIDIEDLRLPVAMVKLDYYWGDWRFSGMVIPEIRFSKFPVFGSDFFPSATPLPPENKPDDGFSNAEYAAAITGVFSGWDIAFYGADIYDESTPIKTVSLSPTQWVREHPRVKMLGAATNVAKGNWLLKAESAWLSGLKYSQTAGERYTRLDAGAGIEYSGFKNATLSLEAANQHLFHYNPILLSLPDEIRKDNFQWALRWVKDYLNDTLTLTFLTTAFGVKGEDGAFTRIDAKYDFTDNVSVWTGFIFYQSGDIGRFKDVGDNDRWFMQLTYSF